MRSLRWTLVRKIAADLGRKPRVKDIEQAHLAGSRVTFPAIENQFGGIEGICRAAGLEAIESGRPKFTRAEMIEHLKEYGRRLKRAPRRSEWDSIRDRAATVGIVVYTRKFGSWGQALKEAGLSD